MRGRRRWPATTSFAAGGRAPAATSTCTSSSARGTSLERAHELAHELRDAIEARFDNADVLIHVEPEDSVAPPGAGDAPHLRHG